MDASTIAPSQLVNGRKLLPLQYLVFILCAVSVFLDGYDTQALGYIAPVLSKSWQLHPGALGPVFSASLFGSLLGSLLLAPLSDWIGRKKIMAWSALWIGMFTLLTGWAETLHGLQSLRFLTGLGLGATIPNALAMAAEYAPARRRASLVALTFCGFAVGAAVGGLAATQLIPIAGWPLVFKVGGTLTIALCPVLLMLLPESLLFLALRAPSGASARSVIQRLRSTAAPENLMLVSEEGVPKGIPASQLFQDGRAFITLFLWILAFLSLLNIYLLTNWLPTIVHDIGLTFNESAVATAGFQLGGIAGGIVLGMLVDRIGPVRVVSGGYVIGATMIVCASVSRSALPMTIAAFGAGFMIIGCQNCINAVNADLYPTSARATALGWSLAVGRIGSTIGPLFAGLLLSWGVPPQTVLRSTAIPTICAAAVMLMVGWAMRRAKLQQQRNL